MVVPPKHPKMTIFSRKTHGCWVPPFLETPIYNQVHLSKHVVALWHLLFKWYTYYLPLLVIIPYFSRKRVLLRAETSFFPNANNLTFHIIILGEGYICRYIVDIHSMHDGFNANIKSTGINRESSLRLYAFFDQDGNTAHTVWKEVRIAILAGGGINSRVHNLENLLVQSPYLIVHICWRFPC